MKLTEFRISMYKGIIDSDWVNVNNLTVLVGTNESGKTSLLKALHKLNPSNGESYEIEKEWPRGRLDESSPKHVVCRARFQLSDQEKSKLVQITDIETESIPDVVEVSRNYAGKLEINFKGERSLNESASVEANIGEIGAILGGLPKVQNNFSNEFKKCADDCIKQVKHLVREEQFTELEQLAQEHEPLLKAKRVQQRSAPYTAEGQFISQYLSSLDQLVQNLPAQSEVDNYLIEYLPEFIYMDEYRIFTGTARLDEVKDRRDSRSLTEADRTFLTILSLSGLDLDQLVELEGGDLNETKKRQNALVGGGEALTRIISPRLSQRDYTIDYRIDGQHFLTNVKDGHDPAAIALEERSRGFQWFFSFDLMLMHGTKSVFKGCVILLDEPGLHLHPGAQKDLLGRFEEYAQENTLLYTTHLPFMIDLKHLDRIRILKEVDNKIVVTTRLTESDLAARYVLQSALGMDFSQNFLVAKRNLVVEGLHDFWILTELSNLLNREEKGLPKDVFITPSSGATKVIPIVQFMIGQDLTVVALFDSDEEGIAARNKLSAEWFTGSDKKSRTNAILLGEAIGASNNCELEDLFCKDFYLDVVKEIYDKELVDADLSEITLQSQDMLWDKVKGFLKKHGIEDPNKGLVAERLRDKLSQMKDASELSNGTKQKAIKLFKAIRKALNE